MFKNFQEHFVSTQESQHAAEFRLFNHRQDRLKLILSAILIPVGCSVFYFLFSGHKYAELENAIGDIESVQTDEVLVSQDSNNQSAQLADDEPEFQLTKTIDSEKQTASAGSINGNTENNSAIDLAAQSLIPETQSKPQRPAGEIDITTSDIAPTNTELNEPTFDTDSLPVEEIFPGRNLAELTELLLADDIFITDADSDYQNSIPGRGQTEVAMLVTEVEDSTLQHPNDDEVAQTNSVNSANPETTSFHESANDQLARTIDDSKISEFELTPQATHENTGEQEILAINTPATTTYTDRITRVASIAQIDKTTSNNSDSETTALELRQRQLQNSKIIMVDKIVGLLKSEIINPNATADTGKLKITNRHNTTSKKSFDIDKLESMLEDI